jgi:LysR family glycine cleavage system transcriptional activator
MRRKIPNTTTLVAFESAARHESFTKAASELSLTQSAVCRQIASLEEFLGVPMFRRTKRGVVLTEAGRSYSRQIATRLDAVERDTLSIMAQQGMGVTIELAVVPTFATRWLMPRLGRFYAEHAGVTVNLTTQTRPFLFDQTEFDAALYYGNAGWPGTDAHFLMREYPVPVCSPALMNGAAQLTPDQIAGLPLLQQSTRPYAWRDWFHSLQRKFPHDMTGTRLELFTMLAQAAMQDMGVALIPPMLIEEELRSGKLVVACDHAFEDEKAYFLIFPEQKSEKALLQAFRDWLVAEALAYRQTLGT